MIIMPFSHAALRFANICEEQLHEQTQVKGYKIIIIHNMPIYDHLLPYGLDFIVSYLKML
jgi:hypothetical protein